MTTAPAAGVAFGLAASPTESVMLATDQGIDLLPAGEIELADGGRSRGRAGRRVPLHRHDHR